MISEICFIVGAAFLLFSPDLVWPWYSMLGFAMLPMVLCDQLNRSKKQRLRIVNCVMIWWIAFRRARGATNVVINESRWWHLILLPSGTRWRFIPFVSWICLLAGAILMWRPSIDLVAGFELWLLAMFLMVALLPWLVKRGR